MSNNNILGSEEKPRFFAVDNSVLPALRAPELRLDTSLRTYVRSLAGMQKEALVVSSDSDTVWRLTSDEGPYLAGHDEAPFPLAHLTAGMIASYATELLALAAARGIAIDNFRLTQDNYYSMDGSALKGTMVGGALAPALRIEVDSDVEAGALRSLCVDAVHASPLNGLLRGEHDSVFTLTCNGRELQTDRVTQLSSSALPDVEDEYDNVVVTASTVGDLMERVASASLHEGQHGVGSSLTADQKRDLHVQGVCTLREDGVKIIDVQLHKPSGSNFRFLSDEPISRGGQGLAPDSATLISAGIGFCFMTQFGRYAAITKKSLSRYRITQDTHFSSGGASSGTMQPGEASPVETHCYIETTEDDDFARTLLDMGEQTCFLHALCRTSLKSKVQIGSK